MKRKVAANQSSDTNPRTFMDMFEEWEQSVEKTMQERQSHVKQDSFYSVQLVQDFERFIHYLENHPVQVTKKRGYISRKYLPDINKQLSIKNKMATSNTEQEYYPYIHFFYFLGLCGRLIEKVPAKGNATIQCTDRLRLFQELTDVEKYFFFLRHSGSMWTGMIYKMKDITGYRHHCRVHFTYL